MGSWHLTIQEVHLVGRPQVVGFRDSVISVKGQVLFTSLLCSSLCVDFILKLGSKMAGGFPGITATPNDVPG